MNAASIGNNLCLWINRCTLDSRYYLHSQLTSIEAPIGNYTCTISTIRMINSLLHYADALSDKETAMIEVTLFCRDYLLDAIWRNLRFADGDQFWELSAVVFEHFLICLERIDIDTFRSSSSMNLTPGLCVLHDILGEPRHISRSSRTGCLLQANSTFIMRCMHVR